jgi:hypothetical protein
MRITNDLQSNSIAATASRPACKPSPRPTTGQDQVQISSQVSRLQAAYDAGTYNVSPTQIATSILNDALF